MTGGSAPTLNRNDIISHHSSARESAFPFHTFQALPLHVSLYIRVSVRKSAFICVVVSLFPSVSIDASVRCFYLSFLSSYRRPSHVPSMNKQAPAYDIRL